MEEKIETRYQRINGEDSWVIDFPDRETGIGKGYNQDISKDVFDYIQSLTKKIEELQKMHRIPKQWINEKKQELESKEQTISELREENERLDNDLQDALDIKVGNGPTALSRVIEENQRLEEGIKEIKEMAENELNYNGFPSSVENKCESLLKPEE